MNHETISAVASTKAIAENVVPNIEGISNFAPISQVLSKAFACKESPAHTQLMSAMDVSKKVRAAVTPVIATLDPKVSDCPAVW